MVGGHSHNATVDADTPILRCDEQETQIPTRQFFRVQFLTPVSFLPYALGPISRALMSARFPSRLQQLSREQLVELVCELNGSDEAIRKTDK